MEYLIVPMWEIRARDTGLPLTCLYSSRTNNQLKLAV